MKYKVEGKWTTVKGNGKGKGEGKGEVERAMPRGKDLYKGQGER